MVGIVIGCILGLCPLLFIDQHGKQLKDAFAEADRNGDGRCGALQK
jgi:gas vesicle protein